MTKWCHGRRKVRTKSSSMTAFCHRLGVSASYFFSLKLTANYDLWILTKICFIVLDCSHCVHSTQTFRKAVLKLWIWVTRNLKLKCSFFKMLICQNAHMSKCSTMSSEFFSLNHCSVPEVDSGEIREGTSLTMVTGATETIVFVFEFLFHEATDTRRLKHYDKIWNRKRNQNESFVPVHVTIPGGGD